MSPHPWTFRGDTLRDAHDLPLYQVLPLSLNMTVAEDMANRAAIANAPELATFAHNVRAALEENGSDANLGNMLADCRALLAKLEGSP